MTKKPHYSMPDANDRTDPMRVRAMSEADIDYSDIPPLTDAVWVEGERSKALQYHVVPHAAGGWTVRTAAQSHGARRFRLLSEALTEARRSARAAKGELVVYSRDGVVRSYRNYAA